MIHNHKEAPPTPFERILVLCDNELLQIKFREIAKELSIPENRFTYAYSHNNHAFIKQFPPTEKYGPIDVRDYKKIADSYDLVISLHCKQIFPDELIRSVKCINIHPGYNPYNRGWSSQVFSIINSLPFGTTIHEMDGKIDHGPIIAQARTPIYSYDTSLTAYERNTAAELDLIKANLSSIISNTYTTKEPEIEGNVNFKKDFSALCELDLSEQSTFKTFIDKLRALSHGDYKNAFFIDPESKKKIFISIHLEQDES